MGNEIDSAVMTTEARTIRKVRIRIIPFIFLLYIGMCTTNPEEINADLHAFFKGVRTAATV